jgi:hypothetical protein
MADVVHTEHTIEIAVSPERALRLALDTPAAADPVSALLLRARGMRPGSLTLEGFLRRSFTVVEETPTRFVAGASGTPWRPLARLRPPGELAAGRVRMRFELRAEPSPTGSRLVTETSVTAADDRARRAFRRYWRVIGPFSSLLRRRWLAAAARRAL